MISIFRKNQRWLLIIIAIVTIIAFAWLYNTTDTDQLGANRVAEMYGKTVYQIDVDRAARIRQMAVMLGMEEFLGLLSSTAADQEQAAQEFIWNLMVLRHQADVLWLEPTSSQIAQTIRAIPAFTRGGSFDPTLYQAFLAEQLPPWGMTERHIEDTVRDSLTLHKMQDLTASPAMVGDTEMEEVRRFFEPLDLAVLRIATESAPEPGEVTDAEIEEFYTENEEGLVTPVFRSAQFVAAGLGEDQKGLEGRERVEAMQGLADRISDFYRAVVDGETTFEGAAEEKGLEILTTPKVDAAGRLQGDKPAEPGAPAGLPSNAVREIFRISPEDSVSEILQDGDRFLVLQFSEEIPSRQLTIEEASPRIRELLQRRKAEETLTAHASDKRGEFLGLIEEGVAPEEAAEQSGLVIEVHETARPWSEEMSEKTLFARAAMQLEAGEAGDLSRGPEGYAFALLLNRHDADEEILATRGAEFREVLLENKRTLMFLEWLRVSREQANLRFYHQRS